MNFAINIFDIMEISVERERKKKARKRKDNIFFSLFLIFNMKGKKMKETNKQKIPISLSLTLFFLKYFFFPILILIFSTFNGLHGSHVYDNSGSKYVMLDLNVSTFVKMKEKVKSFLFLGYIFTPLLDRCKLKTGTKQKGKK